MTGFHDQYPALRKMEAVALFRDLGYRFSGAGQGWAEVTLEASARVQNLYGIVHGGVWLLVADSAMGGALATLAGPEDRVLTAQSDFRWLRALEGETLRARARVLRRGRSLSHCTVEMFDSSGTQVGLGHGTYVVLAAGAG
ncbi:MAG: PaaI family thioesterase [Chloroflexota bacterium]